MTDHERGLRIAGVLAVAAAGCGHEVVVRPSPPAPSAPATVVAAPREDDGPHKAAIAALIQPFLDAELLHSVVIGVYDHGRAEIYGFGAGPGGKPPDGSTLFELGGVSRLYTALLLCEEVQRGEVQLDQPVSKLLPAGVAMPARAGQSITLHELANEASGLPPLPASIAPGGVDPYAAYDEDHLLAELPGLHLVDIPGRRIAMSMLGDGLLGYALGARVGGGYASALYHRVLAPLDLESTFVVVPDAAQPRRTTGTTTDLVAAPPWHWGVLAPAGGLVSDARDQLALIRAELDAAGNGPGALRPAMRLAQEAQLDKDAENEGIGMQIDAAGRHWVNGSTAGFHAFVGFDTRTTRGVVILASTALSPLDRFADLVYDLLAGKPAALAPFPDADQLSLYTGGYDLAGAHLDVELDGNRLYVVGTGEPRHRLVPLTPNVFWLEEIAAVIVFEDQGGQGGGKIARLSLLLPNGERVVGPRTRDAGSGG